ncbi:MAG: DinB family protein [Flavobacteriales bacterium]|nr:MAG: DinB family protein [Flavobacteriales bacterium]
MDRTTIPSSSDFTIAGMLAILERTPNVLHALLSGLDEEWTHHNEGGDTWTPYDVVGHLVHGERTDWMARIRRCLSTHDKAFVKFDRTAMFIESSGKTLDDLLDEFAALRQHNLLAFRALDITDADLGSLGIHPTFGEVELRQLLATWAAHDLGHLTQITRVMCKQYRTEVGPWKEFISVLR